MFKFKSKKLGFYFSGRIVTILSLSMIVIAIIALVTLRKFSDFVINKSENIITTQASDLFLDNTIRIAQKYSKTFREAIDLVEIFANQVEINLSTLNQFKYDDKNIEAYSKSFSYDKKNDLLYKDSNNFLTVYTNNMEFIPFKDRKQFYSLSLLNPLLERVSKMDINYSSTWLWIYNGNLVHTYYRNPNFTVETPSLNKFENIIKNKGGCDKQNINNSVTISSIYVNYSGKSTITVACKHFNTKKELEFITGIDITLDNIMNKILTHNVPLPEKVNKKNIEVARSFSFIVKSTNSQVIISSKEILSKMGLNSQNCNSNNFTDNCTDLKLNLTSSNNPEVVKFSQQIMNKQYGIALLTLHDENFLFTYSKMNLNDWVLGVAVPIQEFSKAITKTKNEIGKSFIELELNFLLVFIFFLLFSILILIVFFRKYILKPISQLRNEIFKIGTGDFSGTVKSKGIFEINDLAESFNHLGQTIKEYISKVNHEIFERRNREKELHIAKRIQQSILPISTPLYYNNKIRLFGRLHPAKEVGGDFYDFFFINKQKLVFLIADVSGKGVSASFFMALAKRTIRNACINEPDDPAAALRLSNEILCTYNLNMFVSIFLVYYNMETGELFYSNGGHNEPVLLKTNGENKYFGCQQNLVIGMMPDMEFKSSKEIMDIGDTLILYTDGVTEANTSNDDAFGEERLLEYLIKNKSLSTRDICRSLMAYVHNFEKGLQFDDITVLVFCRKGIKSSHKNKINKLAK